MQAPTSLLLVGPLLSVVGTIAGVILGFVLAGRRNQEEEARRTDAIRRILQTEIDHNINELEAWTKMSDPYLAKFPGQSNQIWDRQLPTLPTALDSDRLARVHSFYYQRHALSKYLGEGKRRVEDQVRAQHRATLQEKLTTELQQRVHRFLQVYRDLNVVDEGH